MAGKKEKLEQDLQHTKSSAYAAGTLKNLACQWRAFRHFCIIYESFEWPVSEHTLCLFAQYLAYTFHLAQAVRNYLNGVRKIHILMRARAPDLQDIEVRITLLGLNKLLVSPVKQACPLTLDIMLDLVPHLDLNKRIDLAFWGVTVVGFFTFFRKSNLIPDDVNSFNCSKQLTRGHVTFHGSVVILTVTWSKMIQYRQRALEVPLFSIPGSPLCPLTVIKALLAQPGKKSTPLFALRGGIPLTYNMFHKKFRQVLDKAGYQGSAFSSHSMRRGGSLWAFKSGVADSLIQVQGDWTSDSYKRYLSFPVEVRAVVNLKMQKTIQEKAIHF